MAEIKNKPANTVKKTESKNATVSKQAKTVKPAQATKATPVANTSRAKKQEAPAKTPSLEKKKEPTDLKDSSLKRNSKDTSKESEVKKNTSKIEEPKTKDKNGSQGNGKLIPVISLVGFVAAIAVIIGIILSVRSCSPANEVYTNAYKSQTRVNYAAEVTGTTKRKPPVEVKNEGWSTIGYPKYGSTLKAAIGSTEDKVALRNTLIRESSYLTSKDTRNAGGGGYNRMDENGKLYLNDQPVLDSEGNQRYLYKHTASEGLYLGDVSDDEPAVIKHLSLFPRGYESYNITGLYAPAGEVIKIEISAEDMEATSGIMIHIGQALYNRKANNIWAAKNAMNRMPHILNTMLVTKDTATLDEEKGIYTAYVGSFLGGPVYVQNESVPFDVTISGAVKYSHFILGYTTPEEFEENAKSTAPYFDLEVWENGVLHSGPNYYAKPFSYDQLYDAAILWEKISLVSTQIHNDGIVFLYDPFVAAGAAVAFPTQHAVNCPMGWMTGSLNYNAFVNGGAWGNMHEYNHNFQGFGLGNGGEVTNNSLNLVSYSLFTRISSNREIGTVNEGLGGWNRYTSATWALQEITENRYSNGKYGLAIYANMLHNFGQEIYMNSAKTSGGQSVDKWFLATMNASKHDMTYFYKDLIGYDVSSSVLETAKSKQYPMFVPVSSIYQTGRSFNYDGEKKYIETMQPYVIPYGKEYTIDLNTYDFNANIYQGGSVAIPNGFSYKIKKITQPENGTLVEEGTNIYKFTPNDNIRSGKIYVTLEITKDDGAFKVDDVDLVLEFEQSHEINKSMLERTTYTYSADKMYKSATEAFEAGYANYSDKKEGDNQNPILNNKVVQNGNAEVWYTEAGQMADHQIVEVKGKMYSDEAGKYRIALRGRYDCALYVSLDNGKTYELAATYKQTTTSSADFPIDDKKNPLNGTYKDYELSADSWLYFKAVLITRNTGAFSFIGVGWGKFTPEAPILDADGNEIGTIPEHVQISYANAYRSDYEFNKTKFETDYFYTRDYKFDSVDNSKQSIISSMNYKPWNSAGHKIENLVDGNQNTYIHTNYKASTDQPLVLTVDMGNTTVANQMTMYTQYRPNGDYHCPVDFVLEGSLDGEEFFEIGQYTGVKRNGTKISVQFKDTEFRYYRLTITKSENSYIILSQIDFMREGIRLSLDGPSIAMKGNWKTESALSTFGHIFVGKKNSTMNFEFEGNQFALFLSSKYSQNVEVTIDGKKVESIETRELVDGTQIYIAYPLLNEGKHKVTVKCLDSVGIDSIAYWQERVQ